MTDEQIFQLFAGVYDQIRALRLEMQGVKAICLATKDTLSFVSPSKQTESFYLAAYKTRLREVSEVDKKIIALIDDQLKTLRS